MGARYATPESTLTAPITEMGISTFGKKINLSLLKIFAKITKNVISRKNKDFNSNIWRKKSKILVIP